MMTTDPPQPDKSVGDKLIDAARVDGESGMTQPAPLTDERRREILDQLAEYQHASRLPDRRVARMIGVSAAVISQVKRGRYAGDTDRVLHEIAKLLRQAAPSSRTPADRCVKTQFALDVWARVAEGVQMAFDGEPRMVLVTGPSGCGKSLALQACAQQYPEAVYMEITEGNCTISAFLRELAVKLGCREARLSRDRAFNFVVARLNATYRVLIFDEVHHGKIRLLNCIRQIMDRTGCPIVLAGQPILEQIIADTRRDRGHGGTVFSRIGPKLSAEDAVRVTASPEPGGSQPTYTYDRDLIYSVAELRELFKTLKLKVHPGAMRLCLYIANHTEGGMLRTLVFLVKRTARLNPNVRSLTHDLLVESLQHMLLADEFEILRAEIETSPLTQRIDTALKEAAA